MAHVEPTGADEDQPHERSPGSGAAPPAGRKSLTRFIARRRTIANVAAAAVVLAGGALAVNHFSARGGTSAVNGNTVEYAAGHMPLPRVHRDLADWHSDQALDLPGQGPGAQLLVVGLLALPGRGTHP